MAIKRLNYFDHQFLVAGDFTAEQAYHLEMRRRLNRLLYTEGIADGLEVRKSADKKVTVSPGVAIDRLGREMIWEPEPDQRVFDLSDIPGHAIVGIFIEYQEQESDPTTATGFSGKTRVTEKPVVRPVEARFGDPPPTGVILTAFLLDASGNVPGNVDDLLGGSSRQMVRPRNEQGLASISSVRNPGGDVRLVEGAGIFITPDLTNHSIRIQSTFDLGARDLVNVPPFTQLNADNATYTVPVYQPRIVLVVGSCKAKLGDTSYGGGVTALVNVGRGLHSISCIGISIVRVSRTEWSSLSLDPSGYYGRIAHVKFANNEVEPHQVEELGVVITSVSENELKVTLNRSRPPGTTAVPSFSINLSLLCMGG